MVSPENQTPSEYVDEQDALFDIPGDPPAPSANHVVYPHPTERTDGVTSYDERVSEAQADLGGGTRKASMAVEPPTPAKPIHRRIDDKRKYHETDGRTATRDHDNNDAVTEAGKPVDGSGAARAYRAARAVMRLAEDQRKADGDIARQVALGVKPKE